MDIKNIISAVESAAPALATALGGPTAGMAVSLLAHMFGADPKNPEDIYNKIQADPDSQLKLKQLEIDQSEISQKYNVAEVQAEENDVANARNEEVKLDQINKYHIWVLPFFGLLISIGFFTVVTFVFVTKMDESDHDVLYTMIGVLGATFSQVYQNFFGGWRK